MLVSEFRAFLTKSNALALAVGVIIGAAVGNVVTALVGDILMQVIGTVMPSHDWHQSKWVINGSAVLYGHVEARDGGLNHQLRTVAKQKRMDTPALQIRIEWRRTTATFRRPDALPPMKVCCRTASA